MSWYWGVDVGSHAVSIAGLHSDNSAWWRTIELPHRRMRGGQRLHELRTSIWSWADGAALNTPPTAIIVELPVGTFPNPSLMMTAGMVCEVLYAETRAPVLELQSASWKKEVLGHGNATKDEILAFAMAELGYKGAVQDEADALCCAQACRRRFT